MINVINKNGYCKPWRAFTGSRIFLLWITIFFSGCTSAHDYLDEASKYEDQGKIREALPLLEKAMRKDPHLLGAYINHGVDEAALGDYKAAIADYNTVLNMSPDNALALLNRGKNYARLGRNADALVDFNKALGCNTGGDYDCTEEEVRLERAFALYYLDSMKKSYSDVRFCMDRKFQLGVCYRLRGCMYLNSGQTDLGYADLKYAVVLGDKDAVGILRRHGQ
jgi:tetratricopeptide (TPR) repeat protein